MLCQLVGEIALWGIRLQFGEDVLDSGQEHLVHDDDCLPVPTACFNSAEAFFAFWALCRSVAVGRGRVPQAEESRFRYAPSVHPVGRCATGIP